jgi:hypothetical protein
MKTRKIPIHAGLFIAALTLVCQPRALAVRPFVVDDARIIDYGQYEVEHWLEYMRGGGERMYAYNFMGGVSPTDWMELIVGTGLAFASDDGYKASIINPVIQPKWLFFKAEDDGSPGLSLATGLLLPYGTGSQWDRGWGGYVLMLGTTRLWDDWLQIHVNAGATYADDRGFTANWRPYWGIGFDQGIFHKDFRIIGEVFAGDPLDLAKPTWAAQWGVRWLKSDYVNWDMTFGTQPVLNERLRSTGKQEFWAQIGLRLLFDKFTRGGKPGDYSGAVGMFPRR